MYTRCPSCSSTFRVTAAVLQMADGEVRCGSCGAVFNALHTLVDDWSGADFTLPGAPRLIHPDDTTAGGRLRLHAGESTPVARTRSNSTSRKTSGSDSSLRPKRTRCRAQDPGLGEDFETPDEEPEAPPADDASDAGAEVSRRMTPGTARAAAVAGGGDGRHGHLAGLPARGRGRTGREADDEPLFVIGEDVARVGEVGILIRRPPGIQIRR